MKALERWGWNEYFEEEWQTLAIDELQAGRVIEEQKGGYRVALAGSEMWASVAGKLRHTAAGPEALPAVGDWTGVRLDSAVNATSAQIQCILPRRSQFTRKVAGRKSSRQVIAANIDRVFIVTSLNSEMSARRMERYLARVWESGASPVIVLTKADLCDDAERSERQAGMESIALGVPVLVISALSGEGMDGLAMHLRARETVALLGSSGVGKSTLLNRLLGAERQAVREIRADDERGRHATTSRQLFALPNGALLIDTPGLRELQFDEDHGGVAQAFGDIAALAAHCRFGNCAHGGEPGCAVQRAISAGELDAARLESANKLQRELEYQARRNDAALESAERKRWRKIHLEARRIIKEKRG